MNDRVGVHVIASADELNEVESSFWFAVAASTAEEVEEGLCSVEERGSVHGREWQKRESEEEPGTNPVGAEFELHVDVAFVLEAVFKGDDVGMLHCLMNLDLSEELLPDTTALVSLGMRLG
jgi:hypothetical protein